MNKYTYPILIFLLISISVIFISGCGRYLMDASVPVILSRSPSLDATGIPSNEDIVITFNKEMDDTKMDIKFFNQYNTAIYPETYEALSWSTDKKTLTIVKPGKWLGGNGSRVYWTASKEGFADIDGKFLMENTVIANYYMSGFGIVGRKPFYGQENVMHPMTLEVTFSVSVDLTSIASFPITASSEHTANSPYPWPPTLATYYLTNNDKTLNLYVSSWDAIGQVALMVSPEIINSTSTDEIPYGIFLWFYRNSN